MAKLLIASRSMALALRLADSHEVREHSPDDLENLEPAEDVGAVVLDVGDPALALRTVEGLRGRGFTTPVLLVSGYQTEWQTLPVERLQKVHVVPLPITRAALLEGIGLLTGQVVDVSGIATGPIPTTSTSARPAPPAADAATPPAGTRVPAAPTAGAGAPQSRPPANPRGRPAAAAPSATTGEAEAWAPRPAPATPAAGAARVTPAARPAPIGARTVTPATPARGTPGGAAPAAPAGVPASSPTDPVPARPAAQRGGVPEATIAAPPGTSIAPETPRPFPATPWHNRPAADPQGPNGRWGPAPHQPPSLTSPHAVVPATPVAGVRRPAPEAPAPSAPAQHRRRPLLGRRGRGLRPGDGPRTGSFPTTTGSLPVLGGRPATDPFGLPVREPFTGEFAAAAAPEPDVVRSGLEEMLDADAGAGLTPRSGFGPAAELRTPDLVRALLDRPRELYGVADTAQVLADDVVERADADAAAVLVPDGAVWRVAGGVGLRPLERRLVLDESHWLIAQIADTGRAVLIEDTDIVRQQLAGAPLAAWRHLLAVPVPEVRAAVVLARGQEGGPFGDADLTAVVPTVREAATLLTHAMEIRQLARMLAPLRESDGTDRTRGPA